MLRYQNIKQVLLCILIISVSAFELEGQSVLKPDNGLYRNPVLFADYSDPDVIRVDDDYYLVSSSFAHFPGLPVLHSNDLVNWKIIGHAAQSYPVKDFERTQHGNGIWAPSIRYHNGEFYIYFGDPDNGIFMTHTKNIRGEWAPLRLVKKVKGWIDACPFWDEDGKAYLVHAWANSRAGIKSILTLNRMNEEGTEIIDEGTMIFDGRVTQPTIEGPKLYKYNGYYYIFAPAGGVKPGWQTVLRSKNIYGPYEEKKVLEQGSTKINGPHQGAWVDTKTGENWFIHFQDKKAYGRIVHLEPMKWENGWPLIGIDYDHNGIGEPVTEYKYPGVGKKYQKCAPATSDEFDSLKLGLQWQWQAVPMDKWYSLKAQSGSIRLYSIPVSPEYKNIYEVPNILMQKFPAEKFKVTAKVKLSAKDTGTKAGLIIFGTDYAYIAIEKDKDGYNLVQRVCTQADKGSPETVNEKYKIEGNEIYLHASVTGDADCAFGYSINGKEVIPIGKTFKAQPGRWVGAKIGLFSTANLVLDKENYADVDSFVLE